MPAPGQMLACTVVHPELGDDHGGHEMFECPRCGRRSAHPEDLRQGWCANCNAYTATPLLRTLGLPCLTRDGHRGDLRSLPC